MSSTLIVTVFVGYFIIIYLVAQVTSKNTNKLDFFTASGNSPWYVVAFGMIGTSLSGVTFISVPGEVGSSQFAYFQIVLGYLLGYYIIRKVLLPLYYKNNLVSIYQYLEQRFGFWSYKTGAGFFLLSRTIGAAFRLFLVATVMQKALFDAWGVPFYLTTLIAIVLIWVYTFKGGIKTIVWTDTLQTFFMLLAVVVSVIFLLGQLDWSGPKSISNIYKSNYSSIWVWDWRSGRNFFKQFFSGALIALVMTGLDQDMMQKNLTCRTLKDAQKNVLWFSVVLTFVNLLFLAMGVLFYEYSSVANIDLPERTDYVYQTLALEHGNLWIGLFFIIGITAAAYSSADSALTSLTTSFCFDFLNFKNNNSQKIRTIVHIGFSLALFGTILIFDTLNNDSVINAIFRIAGYTYGPLLGLFSFGLVSKKQVMDKWVPLVCLMAPVLSYLINLWLDEYFDFQLGFLVLALNGLLTFLGLMLYSKKC